jgi:hypothetical protein
MWIKGSLVARIKLSLNESAYLSRAWEKSWEEKPKPAIRHPSVPLSGLQKQLFAGQICIFKGDVPVTDNRILGHEVSII